MKILISILICSLVMIGCGTQSGYNISGKAPDGAKQVVLKKLIGKNPVPVDTVKVSDDGLFEITGVADTSLMAYLSTCDGSVFAQFCLSNDEFKVINEEGTSDFEVNGGAENEWYKSFLKEYELSENRFSADIPTLYSFMDSSITAAPDKISLSYFLFRRMYNIMDADQLEVLASKFNEDVKSSVYMQILSRLIKQTRLTQPGNKFIDFVSNSLTGAPVAFSSFFDGKSFILLDFWASWCPYCREESPDLVELYSSCHEKGFEIISVSLDSDKNKWIEAIEHDKLQWEHLSNLDGWECDAARKYGISGIPGNILFSPDGVIIARNLHGDELKNILTTKIAEHYEK